MATLVVTPEQRTLLENLAAYVQDAYGYGVTDGSTKFVNELQNYLLGLPPEYQQMTREFVQATVAAMLSSGFLVSATSRRPLAFVSEVEYAFNCGANYTSSFATSLTSGSTILATKGHMTLAGLRFWWDGSASSVVRLSVWDSVGTTRLAYVDVGVNIAGTYEGFFPAPVTLTPFREYRISKRDQLTVHNWLATGANITAQTNGLLTVASFYDLPNEGWVRAGGCISLVGDDIYPSGDTSASIYLVDPVFV